MWKWRSMVTGPVHFRLRANFCGLEGSYFQTKRNELNFNFERVREKFSFKRWANNVSEVRLQTPEGDIDRGWCQYLKNDELFFVCFDDMFIRTPNLAGFT